MLFDRRGKAWLDELKRADWPDENESTAFIERVLAAGDLPARALVTLAREHVRAPSARQDRFLATFRDLVRGAGDPAFVAPLCEMLADAPASARGYVHEALAGLPLRADIDAVIPLLGHEREQVRRIARDVLVSRGGRAAYERIAQVLANGWTAPKAEAVDALVEIGGTRAFDALRALLTGGDAADQALAVTHLGDRERMGARFDHALDTMREVANGVDGEVAVRIAELLAEHGDESDGERVAHMLGWVERRHQQPLIRALGRIGSEAAVPHLVPFLRSPYVGVRLEAMEALGAVDAPTALHHLIEGLRDDEILVRQKCVEVLGAIGRSRRARLGPVLVAMMRARDVNIRRSVIEVIRAIGDGEEASVWAQLIGYLKDEDWWVRESVTEVLTEVGGDAIVGPVLRLLESSNDVIRRYAIEVLVKVADRSVADRLLQATRDPDWWVRERAIEALGALDVRAAIPHLLKQLEEDADARWAIVKVLGEFGDPAALPHLLPMLDDPGLALELVLEVLAALDRIGDPSAEPHVTRLLEHPEPAIRHRALQLAQTLANRQGADAGPDVASERSPLDRLLMAAREHGGQDLFLLADHPPRVKIGGRVEHLREEPVAEEELRRMLVDITNHLQHRRIFEEGQDLDFSHAIKDLGARFRVNVYRQWTGLAATFRVISDEVMTIEQLGLPAVVRDACDLRSGLFLVTGPTSSGKSTTLAAMIDHINRTRGDHIVTIEDPIEYQHENVRSVINQHEVGVHTRCYAEALRGALRQDPDVILVGEMRDRETIETALVAAETGHLVLGTLHTVSAAKTVDRIIDAFPAEHQPQVRTMLSEVLRGVLSQHLIARADGPGLVLALETMIVNDAIANLIRKDKTFQIPSVMATTAELGNRLMDTSLLELVRRGTISAEEGYIKAENKRELESFLPSRGIDAGLAVPTPALGTRRA